MDPIRDRDDFKALVQQYKDVLEEELAKAMALLYPEGEEVEHEP